MGGLFGSIAKIGGGLVGGALGGPVGAAIGGGLGGLASGGGLKGALLGGVGSYIGASPLVGGALGSATGLTGTGLSLARGALGGGVSGASNGIKGVLTGAALGGAGSYATSAFGGSVDPNDEYGRIDAYDQSNGIGNYGDGVQGALGRASTPFRSIFGGNVDPSSNNSGGNVAGRSYLSPLISGALGVYSNNQAQDALLKQQQGNLAALKPYLNQSFTAGDFTADPGYQFRLSQGQQAVDRAQSARGNFFSGEALKASQDYGQGLADQTYNDAFNRWSQQRGQNIQAILQNNGINDNIGNINAGAITNRNNVLSGALGSALGGDAIGADGSYLNKGGDSLQQLLLKMRGYV